MKRIVIIPLIALFLAYAVFSFIMWDASPSRWSADTRGGFCLAWLFITAFSLFIYDTATSENKPTP